MIYLEDWTTFCSFDENVFWFEVYLFSFIIKIPIDNEYFFQLYCVFIKNGILAMWQFRWINLNGYPEVYYAHLDSTYTWLTRRLGILGISLLY